MPAAAFAVFQVFVFKRSIKNIFVFLQWGKTNAANAANAAS